MRSRRRLVHLLVCAGAAVAWLAAAAPAYAGWFLPEQRLTTNASQQMYPDISGTKVVFQDRRFGNWDISLIDLSTYVQRRLTTNTSSQTMPRISGNRVVYEDARSGHSEIYVYNIATNIERRLLTGIASAVYPAIDGTWVVYYGGNAGNVDNTYAYDLTTDTVKPLSTSGNSGAPDIDGTKVVYVDHDNVGGEQSNGDNVYVYDLSTDTRRALTTSGLGWMPNIDGQRVVYQDSRTGTSQVYLYNLATNTETRLTGDDARASNPKILGTRVWYLDTRQEGVWSIYVHDLTTGIEKRLVSLSFNPGAGSFPASRLVSLSGSTFVYWDTRDGNSDIYLRELAHPKISITALAAIGYNRTAKVSGTLKSASGVPLANKLVTLSTSTNGRLWSAADEQRTTANGTYAMYTPALTSARYVRVRFAGDTGYLGVTSARLRVKPRVYLTVPNTPASVSRGAIITPFGYLKPKHAAGSHPVKLQFYRLERLIPARSTYVLKATIPAEAFDHSGYTMYEGEYMPLQRGTWRVRAYHPEDASNAATYSGWRSFTVE